MKGSIARNWRTLTLLAELRAFSVVDRLLRRVLGEKACPEDAKKEAASTQIASIALLYVTDADPACLGSGVLDPNVQDRYRFKMNFFLAACLS
jgi:hypothetical protein